MLLSSLSWGCLQWALLSWCQPVLVERVANKLLPFKVEQVFRDQAAATARAWHVLRQGKHSCSWATLIFVCAGWGATHHSPT